MALTTNIGQRVEIVNIDTFKEITIALYRQQDDQGPVYLVHSYSSVKGADDRIAFVVRAMIVLGGLQAEVGDAGKLRFRCGHDHLPACRQLFLRACQIDQRLPVEELALTAFDKKTDQEMVMQKQGGGRYQLTGDGQQEKQVKRLKTICGLIIKRGGLAYIEEEAHVLGTSCEQDHDELLGMLLDVMQRVRVSTMTG
jgi:hypothetical protein